MLTGPDAFLDANFARLYDWSYDDREEDVPFYVGLAREVGGPVLEVACGTGRVLIPLAREGFEVFGIDFSEHMLAIAREKLQRQPPDVRRRVCLVQGDMRDFDLGKVRGQTATIRPVVSVPEFPGREFGAVFVPNASVFHLADRHALSQCFACLYRHTQTGGMAVVDVVAPQRMANQPVGEQVVVREGINPATGVFTRELNKKLHIDRDAQVVRVEHMYVEKEGGNSGTDNVVSVPEFTEERFTFEQDYRWLEEHEGVELLKEAGFAEVDPLGGYDGQPFEPQSGRLILVARTALAPL